MYADNKFSIEISYNDIIKVDKMYTIWLWILDEPKLILPILN